MKLITIIALVFSLSLPAYADDAAHSTRNPPKPAVWCPADCVDRAAKDTLTGELLVCMGSLDLALTKPLHKKPTNKKRWAIGIATATLIVFAGGYWFGKKRR